ncbi:MAG: DUF305 domain-containing protein [Pyrinomonadaceae bacterium]
MKKIISSLFLACLTVIGACTSQNSANHTNHTGTNHNANSSISAAGHSNHGTGDAKLGSSANAAAAPYDLQFIDTMSAHHVAAIVMAKMAEKKSARPELKALAQKMIADQQREVTDMDKWRGSWFAGKQLALNMEMHGMHDSMKQMSKFETASGNEFDRLFIEEMIPHHEGAITMSRDALQKSQKEEIKALAARIISSQTQEIEKMREWQETWSGTAK